MFFSQSELDILRANRAASLADQQPIHLFGCGEIGQKLLGKFFRAGRRVAGFIDNNPAKQGGTVEGVPVRSPEQLAADDPKAVVVLASLQADGMAAQCRDLGLENVRTSGEAVSHYGLIEDMEMIGNSPEAAAVMDLWADAASRNLYRDLVRYRSFLELDKGPDAVPGQYFTAAVIRREDLRAFVDCGPFDGQVYRDLRQASDDTFEAYYAFEPDPSAFTALKEQVGADRRAHLFNSAVGARPGRARFDARGDWGSRISKIGGVEVAVDSLDHALAGAPVSMIKMDVEGAELEALAGAETIITRQRPLLAICCYHQDDHMWRIPLWIARRGLGYRLRLLHHGISMFETVCYGIASKH